MALPGSSASFDQFRADDGECHAYAAQMVGGKTTQQSVALTARWSAPCLAPGVASYLEAQPAAKRLPCAAHAH
jgi:hypothetical protein